MVPVLLIFSMLIVHLHDQVGRPATSVSYEPHFVIVSWFGSLIALGVASHVLVLACAKALDRSGNLSWLSRADRIIAIARALGAILLGIMVFEYGLLDAVRSFIGEGLLLDRLAALVPFWALIVGGFVSQYEIDRRVREASLIRTIRSGAPVEPIESRFGFVLLQLRHQMLMWLVPLALISTAGEATSWLLGTINFAPGVKGYLSGALQVASSLMVFAIAPAIVLRIWRTSELGPGELRERILAVCAAHRVRVRGPFVWRTGTGIVNAAVLGPMYPLRYLVYTDTLLELLTPRELDAITAHEVAHLKKWHILWLAVIVIASVGVMSFVVTAILMFAPIGIQLYAGQEWFQLALSVAVLLVSGLVFCFASRRFEWQADAFAVKHISRQLQADSTTVSPESAQTVSAALAAVARFNGIDERRFMPRHGSIGLRRRRVARLVSLPLDRLPIDRQAFWMRVIAAFAMVLTISVQVILSML